MSAPGTSTWLRRVACAAVACTTLALISPATASADATYIETTGGVANTWTNPANAGGYAGPQIGAYQSVQIACKLHGFRVSNGNDWWYRIASSPWNYGYYVSADAFYNNGATSGSLAGTPWDDPAVPLCASGSGIDETAGGLANTWTDYNSAGGTAGPQVASGQTIQITCKRQGFRVANGNLWWYQIASAPWNDGFYVSADAFYNNGATSGSLLGTPLFDPAVPDCAGSSASTNSPTVSLAQGPAAPSGYRYSISLSGFAASTTVSVTCYDSVSPGGFYSFSLTTNASGGAVTASYCYSGDGPDHWVVVNGRVESNHVSWSTSSGGGGGTSGGGAATGDAKPSGDLVFPQLMPGPPSYVMKPRPRDNSVATRVKNTPIQAALDSAIAGWAQLGYSYSYGNGIHYKGASGTTRWISMNELNKQLPGFKGQFQYWLTQNLTVMLPKIRAVPAGSSKTITFDTAGSTQNWAGYDANDYNNDFHWALGHFFIRMNGRMWIGPADAAGKSTRQAPIPQLHV